MHHEIVRHVNTVVGLLYGLLNLALFFVLLVVACIAPTFLAFQIVAIVDVFSNGHVPTGVNLLALGGPIGSITTTLFLLRSMGTAFVTPKEDSETREPKILSLVDTVCAKVKVQSFRAVLLSKDLETATFYTARGRYLILSLIVMRYLTRDELAAIVAHECAHHQNNAMFPNRVHYRSLLMFAAYHKGLAKTMSTIVKLNAKLTVGSAEFS
jgi:Zn-dependent protease with chaperone function